MLTQYNRNLIKRIIMLAVPPLPSMSTEMSLIVFIKDLEVTKRENLGVSCTEIGHFMGVQIEFWVKP